MGKRLLCALRSRVWWFAVLLLGAPGLASATTFTDTITASQTFNVASSPLGGVSGCNLIVGTHVYGTRTITTSSSGTYAIQVTSSTGLGGDPFLAVYEGTFDPANPTANLRACNDDWGSLMPRLEVAMTAGVTYVVMTTTYSAGSLPGTATYQTTPDIDIVPPPVLSAVGVSGVGTAGATLAGTSDVNATGYWVVLPQGQAAPDAARVRNGQNASGAPAPASGNGPMTGGAVASFPIAGLAPGTAYTAYLVAESAPTLWSTVSAVNFSTAAVAPGAPVIGGVVAGDGEATVTFTASTDGGSPITGYTVTSSPGAIVATGAASPIVVTGLTNGTAYSFTVFATNAIGDGPESAPSAAVTPIGPPSLGGFGDLARTWGDPAFTLTPPTSDSAGAFTYSSSDPSVATVAGDVVTLVGVGTTVITADQAADGAYTAGSITANLVVAAAVPTLSGFPDLDRLPGDPAFTLTPPASDSVGAFTYSSGDPSVATVAGDTVTIVGTGSTVITATQAADGNYTSAQITAQLNVGTLTPTLSGFPDLSRTFGDAPFALTPPSSDSPGAFAYVSTDPSVATIAGDVVTIVGPGTASIIAIQSPMGNYGQGRISARLTVDTAEPGLTGFPDLAMDYGTTPFALMPPDSASPGAFTYLSSDPSVARIDGDTVTLVGPGTTTLTAIQAAAGGYAEARITAQLTVSAVVPVLSGFPDLARTYGDEAFSLAPPTSDSAGAFSYQSSDPAVATIEGDRVILVGVGVTTITATQAAQGGHLAASITARLTVGTAVPVLSGFEDIVKTLGEPAFELPLPVSASDGAFTFSIDDGAVATIDGRTVTLVGAGVATITATQAASGNYAEGSATATLTVSGRPDPTQDASVVAGLQAQVDATVRFALAQQTNIGNRLRQRRTGDGAANGLSIGMAAGGGGLSWSPTLLRASETARRESPWSLWTGGVISSGDRDPRNGGGGFDFRSDGLSFGADRRLGRRSLLGVATGFGWNDLDLGNDGSSVKANYQSISLYGLWQGGEHLFVDGQIGYGDLGFRMDRWSGVAGAMAQGKRDGSQVYGALTLGYEQVLRRMRLATYGRLSAGRATLDEYREHGIGIYDLRYAEQTVEHSMAALGVEGSHDLAVGTARLRPYWSVEYWNDIGRNSDALINYVSAPAANDYRLVLPTFATGNWQLGVGADLRLRNGVTLSGLVRHEAGGMLGGVTTFGLQFSLEWDAPHGAPVSLSMEPGAAAQGQAASKAALKKK